MLAGIVSLALSLFHIRAGQAMWRVNFHRVRHSDSAGGAGRGGTPDQVRQRKGDEDETSDVRFAATGAMGFATINGTIMATGPYLLQIKGQSGNADLKGAVTFILEKQGKNWLIAHMHSSLAEVDVHAAR
jgi:hypothetical protein